MSATKSGFVLVALACLTGGRGPFVKDIDPGANRASAQWVMDPVRVWEDFRKAYPFSIQTVALQESTTGEYVLIVAEPPPYVTRDALRAILPGVSFQKHAFGADGWTIDAVQHGQLQRVQLEELVDDLHRLLFDTAYRSFTLSLPAKPQAGLESGGMDFELRNGELASWLAGANAVRFASLTSGEGRTAAALASPCSEVLHSDNGLVGWWIPKSVDLPACRAPARMFAVDSDFVLGAVENPRGMLLIGRERQIPFERMPPLRVETIELLAKVGKDELTQTINPQPVSCFVDLVPPQRWELNLLSEELEDTEFGMLLTVADVLLKSWAMNGHNSVLGFRDYRKPASWPFQQPLTKQLGVDELVFNYDSGAAGVTVGVPGSRCLSVVRTGVLPLAFLPDEHQHSPEVEAAEAKGYAWFAKLGDPHLVRVVQYTAILQAFHAFRDGGGAAAATKEEGGRVGKARKVGLDKMLDTVFGAGNDELRLLGERMVGSAHRASVLHLLREEPQDPDVKSTIAQIEAWSAPEAVHDWLHSVHALDAKGRRELAARVMSPHFVLPADLASLDGLDPEAAEHKIEVMAAEAARLESCLQLLASALRTDSVIGSAYAATAKGWLHGPSLIYDLNVGPIAAALGGHNLKAVAERVYASPTAVRGKVVPMSNAEGWLVHSDDLTRVVVKGRGRMPELLAKAPPRRTLSGALELRKEASWALPPLPAWLRATPRLSADELKILTQHRAAAPDAAVLLRRADGSFVLDNGRGVVEARTLRDAVDRLVETTAGNESIQLELANLQPAEARAVATSLMGRRHALDRTVKVEVANAEMHAGAPKEFRVEDYRGAHAVVKIEESSPTSISGRLDLVADGERPTGVVKWVVRIRDASVDGLQWPTSKVEAWVEKAWNESHSIDDLHAELRKSVLQTLRELFPDTRLVEPKVQFQILQQLQDRYVTLTDGSRDRERIAA